jgi:hypothetical protein
MQILTHIQIIVPLYRREVLILDSKAAQYYVGLTHKIQIIVEDIVYTLTITTDGNNSVRSNSRNPREVKFLTPVFKGLVRQYPNNASNKPNVTASS